MIDTTTNSTKDERRFERNWRNRLRTKARRAGYELTTHFANRVTMQPSYDLRHVSSGRLVLYSPCSYFPTVGLHDIAQFLGVVQQIDSDRAADALARLP